MAEERPHAVDDDGNEGHRSREARRDDETTGRRPNFRVQSSLSDEEERIVSRVLDCAFNVHRVLGPGFKESIYQRAMCLEMDARGLKFECEKMIDVRYKQWVIPGQRVDLLVESRVLVEVKAIPRLRKIHSSQVYSYLKTMDIRIGLLLNFKAQVLKEGLKRVVR